MAKNKKDIIREIPDDEIELFGAHKTKAEIKADEKVRKAKERALLKEEMAERRKAAKEGTPKNREMLPVFIVTGIVVALCVVLLIVQFNRADTAKEWARNESFENWFTDVEVAPTLTEDGVKANLVEAYYTNNGHLKLRMILGNGSAEPLKVKYLTVKLSNGDDQYIGGGKINAAQDNVIVPAEGTLEYSCYIKPEHLEIKNDPLLTLAYDISITAGPVE